MTGDSRILIVCTGNVCRSPFIERMLQRRLADAATAPGLRTVVRSAGTAALTGQGMDPRAAAQTLANGADPAGFTARQLTATMVAEADLVLTATRSHRGDVASLHPKALAYTFTLRDFADLVRDLPVRETTALEMGTSPARYVVTQAAAQRGRKPPLNPEQADVVDPYRRSDEVFIRMAEQVIEVIPTIVRALAG